VPNAPEAAEVFEVLWVPLAEAVQRCLRGEIEDSKTCLGVLRAAAALAPTDTAETPC
jgi:hypothetical protein